MNKVCLIGRLTRDPELRFIEGTGNGVSRFSIAAKRAFKKDEVDFINCVAFGKTAEAIAQYMLKGNQIGIVGSIRTGSYDKEGTRIYTTDVLVESFYFINSKSNKGEVDETDNFDFDDIEPVNDGDSPF